MLLTRTGNKVVSTDDGKVIETKTYPSINLAKKTTGKVFRNKSVIVMKVRHKRQGTPSQQKFGRRVI